MLLISFCNSTASTDAFHQHTLSYAQANKAVKAQLEQLTEAARAEEVKEAGLAADVQQMRMEVAAKQARPSSFS